MSQINLSLKQNLLALIAALLVSIASASMDTVQTAGLATNMPPSTIITQTVNTAPLAQNTFLATTDPISIYCEVNNYEKSYLSNYDDVAGHIRSLTGNATLGNKPGGGWCLRYSCTSNLAIYGCNDNQADTQVPWATMADYADAIKGKCTSQKKVHGHWKDVVLGQAFDAGGWNVILGLEAGSSC